VQPKAFAREGRGMPIDTETNGANSQPQTFRNIFRAA